MSMEALMCNTGLMSYYAYFPEIMNIPPPQIFTNGFMYVFIGVALAYLVPWLQKSSLGAWRWLLVVPTVIGAFIICVVLALPMLVVGATYHRYPVVNWVMTGLGIAFTVAGALALLYSPWVKRFRNSARPPRGEAVVNEVTA
jgi:hypothetical protein